MKLLLLTAAVATLALGLTATATLASPPTPPPTNQDLPCDQINLRWACRRRPGVCEWVGSLKNGRCQDFGTTRSPTKPTTRSPTRRPTTRSPTRPTTRSPTVKPTTARPTFVQLPCFKIKKAGNCNAKVGSCAWVRRRCVKATVSPTQSPTRKPTVKVPTCADFATKATCCGAKFASGVGQCINRVSKFPCVWSARNTCVIKGSTGSPTMPKPTKRPSKRPTTASPTKKTSAPTPQEYEV